MLTYDKHRIKELLTIENIYDLLVHFDANPKYVGDDIVCRTICHNGDKEALYYYSNNSLFHCYTDSCGSFDVFELVSKLNNLSFSDAVSWVAEYFHLYAYAEDSVPQVRDWEILRRYEENMDVRTGHDYVSLPEYPSSLLEHYPQPEILPWTREGISKDVCDFAGIRYDPTDGSIIIPHYDQSNRMIGIRKRTLVRDNERFGKYLPWQRDDMTYRHPLAFNLYGLNWAKGAISERKVAIVVEGEKSVLQYMSMFSPENNLCVGVCGQNVSMFQFKLLYDLGIRELAIGFDKDFEELGDDDFDRVVNRLVKLNGKFAQYVNVSFIFDKIGVLPYKGSPTDAGKEVFELLWKSRTTL